MNGQPSCRATLAVIGGGQAAKALLSRIAETAAQGDRRWHGATVIVFERGHEFGTGLAWSRRNVLPEHMTSLASAETRAAFGDRQRRQMPGLVRLLAEFGVTVQLAGGTEIVDLRAAGRAWHLRAATGAAFCADAVVLATGHWPSGAGESPWPAQALQRKHAATHDGGVIIHGTGLSAVDSAITLGLGAGRFVSARDGGSEYRGRAPLHITMLSPSGCLPAVWGDTPPVLSDLQQDLAMRLGRAKDHRGVLSLSAALDHLADLAAEMGLATAGTGFARDLPLRDRLAEITRLERARARFPWRTLRHDLALVRTGPSSVGQGKVALRRLPVQSFLLAAIPVLSEAFHGLDAADRALFKAAIRGPLYRHAMPMVVQSAVVIDALFRAGALRVGRRARCIADRTWSGPGSGPGPGQGPREGPGLIVNAMGQEEDMTRNPHPLWRALLAQGLIDGPADGRGAARAARLRIDPASRRLRNADLPLFAMGPVTVETFMDAQSIGHLMRDATAIVQSLAGGILAAQDRTTGAAAQ